VKTLIGLALEPLLLQLGFAQPPDKQRGICARMNKSDLSNEQ
jgi:hypothetical protein